MTTVPNPVTPAPSVRTSKAAVTSLIFGILSCIPVITSPIAVITGFIGLSATRRPGVKGRGMAIIGLILGFLGIVWSIGVVSVAGVSFWAFPAAIKMARQAAEGVKTTNELVSNLTSGDVDAAQAKCTSSVSREDLVKVRDELAAMGRFEDAKINSTQVHRAAGELDADFSGRLTFEKGVKRFEVHLVTEGGVVKVDRITLSEP
jgi:hypothetical protein